MKKIILSILILTTLGVSAQIPSGSHLEFEFTNGNLTNTSASGANDLSGSVVATADRFGAASNAIDLSGALNGVTTGIPNTLESTLSFWMKKSAQIGTQRILQIYGAGGNGYRVEFDGSNDKLIVNQQMENVYYNASVVSNANLDDANWHHIVVRTSDFNSNGVEIEVFIDNVLQTITNPTVSGSISNFINDASFVLSPTNNYTGDLDDIYFYKTALTDVGIAQLNNYPIVYIPNVNFKDALLNHGYGNQLPGVSVINTNGDAEIQVSEAAAYTGSIQVGGHNIADFTGMEAFTAATFLKCAGNSMTSINLSNNIALTDIECGYCSNMTSIDLSSNTNLTKVSGSNGAYTSITLGSNTNLLYIYLNRNSLTGLDVTQLPNLHTLVCNSNNLQTLDVSQNASLSYLKCEQNNLTALDLSQNLGIAAIYCHMNNLTSLNVANGNNTSIGAFYANQNNLTCIHVDDAVYSTTNWTSIDATASFSSSVCPIFVSSITVQNQGGVSTITTDGGTLQMEATVLPANATDLTYTWSVTNGTGSATINSSGLLTAQTNGTVTVTATANDGSGMLGSSVVTISNQIILVSSISVQGQGGVYTITNDGGTLQMQATTLPANAADGSYTWSIASGTGTANMSAGGILEAQTNGTVTVFATANDGSGVVGSTIITISNQIVLVNSISVTDQGGATSIAMNNGTLQMIATILPANATDQTYTWSVDNTNATLSTSGILTAQTNGTVTVTATANDGSGVTGSATITIYNQNIAVSSVSVTGQGGVSTITTNSGNLQMIAFILPISATDQSYTWSIANGTGSATIDNAGLLTAITNGIVTVIATANDGSGVTGSITVTISNQTSVSINEPAQNIAISIYPNPTTESVIFSTKEQISSIELYNLSGQKVAQFQNTKTINISSLPNGIYTAKVIIGTSKPTMHKLVKE